MKKPINITRKYHTKVCLYFGRRYVIEMINYFLFCFIVLASITFLYTLFIILSLLQLPRCYILIGVPYSPYETARNPVWCCLNNFSINPRAVTMGLNESAVLKSKNTNMDVNDSTKLNSAA